MCCTVPDGVHEVEIQLDTICNAAAVEASGHLSYGNNSVGIINWPTCLVYPEGAVRRRPRFISRCVCRRNGSTPRP